MPIKRNAMKAVRQAKRRAARNLVKKQAIKQAVKGALKAIQSGEKELLPLARQAQKALGKAAKVGVIKKRTAARRLSRLMKKINAAAQK